MHYLDNSSTTKVNIDAAKKAMWIMTECFGNPSSLHSLGFSAEKELRKARETIINSLSVNEGELIFTSGGTESNNTAILGAALQNIRNGNRIVSSEIEHPSVKESLKKLSEMGFEVVFLKPDKSGNISKKDVFNAVNEKTILVSLMSVNNETGAILPLEEVAGAIKRKAPRALFHTDNVQGFLKNKLNIKKLGIDLVSISAHKVHGMKGTGALYIAKNKRIKPLLLGGGQEKNIRSGTENLPGIVAFSEAVSLYKRENEVKALNEFLREELKKIPYIKINSPDNASPYILNFSLMKVRGETMLHYLSEREIYVSVGSACSGSKPSAVLSAMELSPKEIESSVRVSFSPNNNREDVDALIFHLKEGLENIAHI